MGELLAILAILPVMPKGVEHDELEKEFRSHTEAILPVMPKGVEHFALAVHSRLHHLRFFP